MAIGVEYGCKFVLEGPDGTKAVFNDSTDPNFVGALSPENCSGLDSADVREDATDKTEADGRTQGNNYLGGRPIVLAGMVIASSIADRAAKVDKILAASLALRSDATLTWYPPGEPAGITLKVRRNQPTRVTKGYVKEFQIAIVANSAYPSGVTQKSVVNERREGVVEDAVVGAAAITTDSTYVYWARGNDIWRSKLNGTSNAKFIEAAASSGGIKGLAVNATHIFWGDVGGGQIGRAKIDGTEKTQAFITTPTTIRGIAITATNIYWAEAASEGAIGRATIAGAAPEAAWLTAPTASITSIAVNATHLFWGSTSGHIGRATLAGAESSDTWLNLGSGTITAVEATSSFVYFAFETAANAAIARVKTDATGWRYYTIFSELGLVEGKITSLDLQGSYLYHATGGVRAYKSKGYAVDRTSVVNKMEPKNEGNADASPVIKVYGPYSGTLEITNESDGGKKLVIPYELLPEAIGGLNNEDYLEINMENHTIKWFDKSAGTTTSVYKKLSFTESEWWKLKPGTNAIVLDSATKVELTYQDTWA